MFCRLELAPRASPPFMNTTSMGATFDLDVIQPVSCRRGGIKWTARSPRALTSLMAILSNPDAFLTNPETLLRDTVLVTLARLPDPTAGSGPWLLRRTNYGKPQARVRDLFRCAGPLRAFQRGLDFERAGLPTPRVLAAGIRRVWHQPVKGYLVVEEIRNAETLQEQLHRAGRLSRVGLGRLAAVIARMHEHGITHGDLTINNLLLDKHTQPWFIDLERARVRSKPVNRRAAVEDFFRLARHVEALGEPARAAAWQLLTRYCTTRGWKGQARSLAADIAARLERKVGPRARLS